MTNYHRHLDWPNLEKNPELKETHDLILPFPSPHPLCFYSIFDFIETMGRLDFPYFRYSAMYESMVCIYV